MARSYSKVRYLDIFYIILGSLLLAFSMVAFTVPNKIATGGLSGIATVLYYEMDLPVGVSILVGNLFLVALQAYVIGRRSAWKTILSIIVTSISIEILMNVLNMPPLTKEPILACLYGGIISGVGVGLNFKAGGTTGGIDIICQILNFKYHTPIGDVTLISNIGVTFFAGWAFGPELALYGLITVFFNSQVVDAVLEGMPVYRNVMIITKFPDEVSWAIIEDLHRGVTSMDGVGVYSAKPTSVLFTAVHRKEMPMLRHIVHEYDHEAFIIVGDARQIIGKGFVNLDDEIRRETG